MSVVPGGLRQPADLPWDVLPARTRGAARAGLWQAPATAREGVASGTRLTPDVALFHDMADGRIAVAPVPGTAAPHGVTLRTSGADGSYVSLAVDIDPDLRAALSAHDLIRLHAPCQIAGQATLIVRLNMQIAAATRRVSEPLDSDLGWVDFDPTALDFDASRLTGAWFDLILAPVGDVLVAVADCVIVRHPRADV